MTYSTLGMPEYENDQPHTSYFVVFGKTAKIWLCKSTSPPKTAFLNLVFIETLHMHTYP